MLNSTKTSILLKQIALLMCAIVFFTQTNSQSFDYLKDPDFQSYTCDSSCLFIGADASNEIWKYQPESANLIIRAVPSFGEQSFPNSAEIGAQISSQQEQSIHQITYKKVPANALCSLSFTWMGYQLLNSQGSTFFTVLVQDQFGDQLKQYQMKSQTDFLYKRSENNFTFNSFPQDKKLKIVFRAKGRGANSDFTIYLTNVHLKVQCPSGQVKQLIDGSQACLTSDIAQNSKDCFAFQSTFGSTNDYECAQCDPANPLLVLTTFGNGYKGCIIPCPANRLKTLVSGKAGCVSQDVLDSSINCFMFGYKSGSTTEFECAACDQSSTATVLVDLESGYKGCAQTLVPSVKLYKPSTTKDAQQNFFMIPAVCNDGISLNTDQRLAVPSLSFSPNDLTGGICRSSYANIDIWQVQSSQYVFGRCEAETSPRFTKEVEFVTGTETTKGCIYSGQDNAYDGNCSFYGYANQVFNCSMCKSNFNKVSVDFSPNVFTRCLAQGNINFDSFCYLYQKETFVCKQCLSSSRTVVKVFDGASYFYRCIPSSATDYAYDSKCVTYNTSFACTQCNKTAGYVRVLVMVNNNFYSRCKNSAFNEDGEDSEDRESKEDKEDKEDKEIGNCYAYDINFNCICKKQFVDVLVGSQIVKRCITKTPDQNCQVYDVRFKCLRCATGFEKKQSSTCQKIRQRNGGAVNIREDRDDRDD